MTEAVEAEAELKRHRDHLEELVAERTEELRTSEERLRLAMEGASLGTWYRDLVRDRIEWSERCREHLGLPPEGTPRLEEPYTRMHPDDREMVKRAVTEAIERRGDYQAEYRVVDPGGEVRWIRALGRVYAAPDGSAAGIGGVTLDVTKQKHAEADLRIAEQRWQFALEGTGDGIWDWDVPTGRIYYSRRWKEMLGYSEDEVSNDAREWDSRIHLEDRPAVLDAVARYLDGRSDEYAFEHRLRCRDGSYRWILSRGLAVERDAAGRPVRLLGVHTDVSRRKAAEEEVRAARDRLAAANMDLARASRMKDEFLASMSHEMRTPLTAIVGTAEHLLAQPPGALPPETLRHVESIEKSGRRLQELVDDVLDVARLDAGKVELQRASCLAADVAEAAARRYRPAADEKRQALSVRAEPEGLVLVTDAARLVQLLGCLLGNAVKFTPAGGRIELVVSGDAAAGVARLAVSDSGIGTAPENVGRLFRDFVQLDGRTERAFGGAGLGLALVKRLAALLGGTIGVESELGKGSCFTLTLPWAERAVAVTGGGHPAPAEGEAPPPAGGLGSRIPPELGAALHDAVERADAEEVARLAARLEEHDAEAARPVRTLAEGFDYERLLRELEAGPG